MLFGAKLSLWVRILYDHLSSGPYIWTEDKVTTALDFLAKFAAPWYKWQKF